VSVGEEFDSREPKSMTPGEHSSAFCSIQPSFSVPFKNAATSFVTSNDNVLVTSFEIVVVALGAAIHGVPPVEFSVFHVAPTSVHAAVTRWSASNPGIVQFFQFFTTGNASLAETIVLEPMAFLIDD
jgi:hypothetical protein